MNQNIDNPFIKAAIRQLRFSSPKGPLTVEDLFQLSRSPKGMEQLDEMAVTIEGEIKPQRRTFRNASDKKADQAAEDNQTRLEILVFVIEAREAEQKEARTKADKNAQRAFLEDLRQKKRLNALESLSEDEIDARLAALDAPAAPAEAVAQ